MIGTSKLEDGQRTSVKSEPGSVRFAINDGGRDDGQC